MASLIAGPTYSYIGTHAERIATVMTGIPVGSIWFETDTSVSFYVSAPSVWSQGLLYGFDGD